MVPYLLKLPIYSLFTFLLTLPLPLPPPLLLLLSLPLSPSPSPLSLSSLPLALLLARLKLATSKNKVEDSKIKNSEVINNKNNKSETSEGSKNEGNKNNNGGDSGGGSGCMKDYPLLKELSADFRGTFLKTTGYFFCSLLTGSRFLHLVYYGVGHDDASSLCGEVLMKERALEKPNARVSLFFAGIGDARNLFATLVDIMKQEKRSKACRHLRYHFTLNDVKAPTLARDLLILLLLDELAQMTDYSSGAAREVLATIFFTFIGTIVPAYVFKHLQGIISKALCLLRSESRPLPWLHIYKANLPAVIKTLSSWQKEAFEAYSTAYFIDIVRNGMMPNRGPDSPTSSMFRSKLPKSCQYEQEGYYRTALLLLPNESLKEHDLDLWKLIQGNEALKLSQRAQGVKEYLQKSWRINVTLLDPELLYMPPWQQLVFNPFNLASDLYSLSVVEAPRNPTKLYDYVAPFFVETAKALKSLKNRILMEMIVGDCCDVLEGLRLGLLDHRNSGPLSKEGEQSVLPTSYDRVHLSNIPLVKTIVRTE